METKVLPQIPATQPVADEINAAFNSGKYKTLKVLMAYASWNGLSLIHESLEKFYKAGGKIEFIFGVGENGTEIETLRYLNQRLPKGTFWIFGANSPVYTFHPKVFIFEGKKEVLTIIGSNNLTQGGFFANTECAVRLTLAKGNKNDDAQIKQLNDLWTTHRHQTPPFKAGNLRQITGPLLKIIEKSLPKKPKTSRSKRNRSAALFPGISIIVPHVRELPKPKGKKKTAPGTATSKGKMLLLEVLKETGADGAQIQIPREVITDYFKAATSDHQTIQLSIDGGDWRPAVLCHFPNKTHRVTMSELSGSRRPLMLQFKAVSKNSYTVSINRGTAYRRLLKKCSQQTRTGAKHWAIL